MLAVIQPVLNEENVKGFLNLAGFDPSHRDYLHFWLKPGSAYHRYGRSRVLLAKYGSEIWGGIVVSLNPRMQHDRRISNFHSLWLKDHLNDDVQLDVTCRLLRQSEKIARKWGAQRMIGPLACSTWHNRYRVLYEKTPLSDSIPEFPGEAVEDMRYKQYYEHAGYQVDKLYMSTAVEPRTGDHGAEFTGTGRYEVRILEDDEILKAGHQLFPLLRRVFGNNYLFAGIDVDEFMALQKFQHGLKTHKKLYLVLSKTDQAVASFLWSYSYACDGNVFHVVKTLGTSPEYRGQRLGQRLLNYGLCNLKGSDTRKIIYALMVRGGSSSKISSNHLGDMFRTYAIYGQDI